MNHSSGTGRKRRRRTLPVAAAGLVVVVAVSTRLRRVAVEGTSMLPTLEPGDRLLVWRGGRLRADDLVAVRDPRAPGRTLVKRIAASPGGVARLDDGSMIAAGTGYVVVGDNPGFTTDSRHFGPIDSKSIQGRLVYRYGPERRRGRI